MLARNRGLSSHSWLFDSHNNGISNRSPWLQSTLSDLEEKTMTMLKLIETDADSFAQRAEMYCKKRPELISMVEDFYRTHRSLAERYDQAKFESGARLLTPGSSPRSFTRHQLGKSLCMNYNASYEYDSFSESFGQEDFNESEVDDPEEEEEPVQDHIKSESEERTSSSGDKELIMELREELERLREENKVQREQLMQKDEEKRDVIRQLTLAMNLLREENLKLGKSISQRIPKRETPLEANKFKQHLLGRLLNGFTK